MGDGPLLLGVDVGTTGTKAVLVDREGREVSAAAGDTPFATRGERVEMEVEALRRGLADVLGDLGDARARVAAVGVAGMAESGAPFDAARRPLAPVIAWHDGRGEETVALLERRFGPELPARIGQPVRSVLTVAKLGWLLAHGVRRPELWLGVPELIVHALTGAEATEVSLAARTGCYDVASRQWIPEVAEAVGLPLDLFPDVRAAGSVMGRVSPEGAAWSRLPDGIPATIAGHDHLAGMAGAGVRAGEVANSVGTAETIVARSATLPDIAAALELRVAVSLYPGGEEWAALVGAARAGLVLRSAATALGLRFDQLDDLAEQATPARVGDLVDPLARGEPVSLPDVPPGEVWSGLLEALVGRAVEGYTRLSRLTGPAEALVVFGGGSGSRPWLGAKAAARPVPVRRSPVAAAVARGAALHAGAAAGWWASADDAPLPP